MRAYLSFQSLLVLASLGFASLPAHAQSTCSADSDCVKGWACQVTGGSTCAAVACAPGEKCESQPSDCVNEEFKSCRPGPCQVDSDCAADMACYTHSESDCAPSACSSDQVDCPKPTCETRTESRCVPRYVLPCTTASDCGAGFSCESAGEQCSCSGSAGGSDSDGGSPPPVPESCTCEASKELRCHAPTVSCAADGDCTAGWTCAVVGSSGGCGKAPASNSDPGAGAQGGATPAPDCTPSVDVKQCVPPYYALVGGINGVERGASDSGGTPTQGGGVSAGDAQDVAAIPPTANASGNDSDTSTAGGCSMAHGAGSGSTLVLFGALGLFSALRRRRAS